MFSIAAFCCTDVAADCSFPFTYEGALYGCITNMASVSTAEKPFACMGVNATPIVCSNFSGGSKSNIIIIYIYGNSLALL